MTRSPWHIQHEDGALILARRLPVRFDLAVRTRLPVAGKLRLAHQIRQDMWRALQGLRGFAPIVRIADGPDGLEVTAGGQVEGRVPRAWAEERIAEVLEDTGNRARWIGWAA